MCSADAAAATVAPSPGTTVDQRASGSAATAAERPFRGFGRVSNATLLRPPPCCRTVATPGLSSGCINAGMAVAVLTTGAFHGSCAAGPTPTVRAVGSGLRDAAGYDTVTPLGASALNDPTARASTSNPNDVGVAELGALARRLGAACTSLWPPLPPVGVVKLTSCLEPAAVGATGSQPPAKSPWSLPLANLETDATSGTEPAVRALAERARSSAVAAAAGIALVGQSRAPTKTAPSADCLPDTSDDSVMSP